MSPQSDALDVVSASKDYKGLQDQAHGPNATRRALSPGGGAPTAASGGFQAYEGGREEGGRETGGLWGMSTEESARKRSRTPPGLRGRSSRDGNACRRGQQGLQACTC